MQEAKQFVSLLAEAIEKGVFQLPNGSNERVQMYARGPFQSGESYQRGDVVSVPNGPIYICLEDTTSDPRSNSAAWLIMSAIGYGGGYPGGGGTVTPPVVSSLFAWSDDNGKLLALDDAELSWTFNLGAPIGYPTLTYGTGGLVSGSWSTVGSKIIFTPSGDYNIGEVIIVDFNAVLDANGDPLVGVPSPWTYQVAGFLIAESITPTGTQVTPAHPDFMFKYTKVPAATPTPTARYSDGALVPGTWAVVGFTHQFTPSTGLVPSETITFNFDNVRDATGEPLVSAADINYSIEPFRFVSFTTTNGDQNATALEQVIATFNGVPLLSSLQQPKDQNNLVVPGAWSVSGNVATFTPVTAWENFTAPMDFGLFNVQGQNSPPPPAQVPNLTFIDAFTGQQDNLIDDPNEFVMLRFNGAVDLTSIPIGFVRYTVTGFTPPVYVTYYQVENALSAPHVGLVINPPTGGWPLTPDGFYDIDISAFTSGGNPVTNPQVIRIPSTLIAAPITLVSSTTPNGDGTVDGEDTWTFTFTQDPDAIGKPVFNQDGVHVPGFWNKFPGTGVIQFQLQSGGRWEDFGTSFSWDNSEVRTSAGILISSPQTTTVTLKRTLTQLSIAPLPTSLLTGSAAITVTFNTPPGAGNMPGVLENGVGMPGTWSDVAGTSSVRFQPSRNWTPAATVVVSWVGLVDGNGTAVSNPATQSYQVLDQFLFVDSDPVNNNSPIYVNGQFQLRFNKPVDLSTLLLPRVSGQNVPGTWSYVSGDATRAIFISSSDMSSGWNLIVDYANARSTTNIPISNPGFKTYYVPSAMTFNFAFPAPGSNLTGSSAFFVDFDMPPNPSTMPTVLVVAGGFPVGKAGTWTASGNRAIFQPDSPWGTTQAIAVGIGPNVKSVWGTGVANQTSFQYTST